MDPKEYDVVVIGGGPAGMLAAGRAAERGLRVLLLEKNTELGKKLLITGGGRCNVTNADPDTRNLIAQYGEAAKFLHSAFAKYGVAESLAFFNERGVETKVEALHRVFPVSDSARSIRDALRDYIKEHGVTIQYGATVTGFTSEDGYVTGVTLKNGSTISARAYILATGGRSRPETGSTGDGFTWLADIGHTIRTSNAALVPLSITDAWVKKIPGLTLNNVRITVFHNDVRQESVVGKLLFTHFGVTGPTVLNMSRDIGVLLQYGDVTLSLDLFPKLDSGDLDRQLIELFEKNRKLLIRNALIKLVPQSIATTLLTLTSIPPETICNSVTKDQRQALIRKIKNLTMSVEGLMGLDKAVVTSGGVALEEVDFKTMTSRLYPNLHLIGDILDINRPTGGYSLQLCWTTGYIAGESVCAD